MSVMHRVTGHPSIQAQVMRYENLKQQYYNLRDVEDDKLRASMRSEIVANRKAIRHQVCSQIADKYMQLKWEQNYQKAKQKKH